MSKRLETYNILANYNAERMSIAEAYTQIQVVADKYNTLTRFNISYDVYALCNTLYKQGDKDEAIVTLIVESDDNISVQQVIDLMEIPIYRRRF